MPDDFMVHDITVNETTQIPPSGVGLKRLTIVRFFVGTHGPFQLEYDTHNFTAERAKADITAKVAALRTLTTSY